MFGYKIIKSDEMENLKLMLDNILKIVESQASMIDELSLTVREHNKIISNLTDVEKINNDNKEEKTIKKVRRNYTKKSVKKEE
jgi:hypothetical protein